MTRTDAWPLPAIVFTGPFTGVEEQVAGRYAERIADRGYVTLAFGHRNFGASDGRRPQHEDPTGKLADLSAATSFLARHDVVDAGRIGCIDERLIAAWQERCHHEPGDVVAVFTESQPAFDEIVQYRVIDADLGTVEKGWYHNDDADNSQPWLPDGPIPHTVTWRREGYEPQGVPHPGEARHGIAH